MLTVRDTFTKECLGLEVGISIMGSLVPWVLDRIGIARGCLESILQTMDRNSQAKQWM